MNKSTFEQKRDFILARLKSAPQLPAEDSALRKERSKKDFFFFCKTYLPHYFEKKNAPFHKSILRELESRKPENRVCCIAAPRGFAKSTVASFAYPLWCALFGKRRFIVLISASESLAEDLAKFIRLEILDNPRVAADFPETRLSGSQSDFSINETRVRSRSWRQGARGLRYRQHRPDLIILDDLEKDSDAFRGETSNRILEAIRSNFIPALHRESSNLLYIGTVLSRSSALYQILSREDAPYHVWKKWSFSALRTDKSGREISLWPAAWPVKLLREKRNQIGELAFLKEYQNTPLPDSLRVFREEDIRYFEEAEISMEDLEISVFIDPSAKESDHHDFKAVVAVGSESCRENYYLLFAWIRHDSVGEMIRAVYRIYEALPQSQVVCVGMETNGFQNLLPELFRQKAEDFGVSIPLTKVVHTNSKRMRIERRSLLTEKGRLFFPKTMTPDLRELLSQMLSYPDGRFDDGVDALDGAISLLENGGEIQIHRRINQRKSLTSDFSERRTM